MLEGLVGRLEEHHGVRIAPEALDAAIDLSVRYICGRFLPDKAIDLVDEAAARVRISGLSTMVRREDIEAVVSQWTGVPVTGMVTRSFPLSILKSCFNIIAPARGKYKKNLRTLYCVLDSLFTTECRDVRLNLIKTRLLEAQLMERIYKIMPMILIFR